MVIAWKDCMETPKWKESVINLVCSGEMDILVVTFSFSIVAAEVKSFGYRFSSGMLCMYRVKMKV